MAEHHESKSVAASDVQIVGSITFKGELAFGGKLSGGSIKGRALSVGASAKVDGDIECDALSIAGVVNGDVTVTGKCDLHASAQLVGNLNTSRLVMADGATLIGQVEIRPTGPGSSALPSRK
jgi:cytoskeletal protein CcmA (bactofilin family)